MGLQIAMWGGGCAEHAHLLHRLEAAVANQGRLVMLRWLLTATTLALDYAGAVLNYACVALPVAAGEADTISFDTSWLCD